MGEQDRVHTLLQARAVADEVQPPARPLALGAHERVGEPDRRHEVAAAELGQHPGVDAVGLAGQRRQPLHLLRVGDLDLPARELEPVVHEARAVHRLDRGADRRAVTVEPLSQAAQTILAWTTYFVQVETIAGNHNAAKAAARTNIVRLQASGDIAHASTQAVLLADMLLDEGATDEADEYRLRLAENKANASNVYVQFLRRSARARILARAGRTTEAEEMARDAVAIASPTDALRDRARTHFALAEVLQLAGRSNEARAEAATGRKLLRPEGRDRIVETPQDAHARATLRKTKRLRPFIAFVNRCY